MNADVPLAADHFRYFARCIRAEEGTTGEIDHGTIRISLSRADGCCRPDQSLGLPPFAGGGLEARTGPHAAW